MLLHYWNAPVFVQIWYGQNGNQKVEERWSHDVRGSDEGAGGGWISYCWGIKRWQSNFLHCWFHKALDPRDSAEPQRGWNWIWVYVSGVWHLRDWLVLEILHGELHERGGIETILCLWNLRRHLALPDLLRLLHLLLLVLLQAKSFYRS